MDPKKQFNILQNDKQDQPISRKKVLQKLGDAGKNFLTASLLSGTFIGFSPKKSAAQFEDLEIVRSLNLITQIEMMQELFYVNGIINADFLTGSLRTIIKEIQQNQKQHIVILKNVIATYQLRETIRLKFDFTAEGQFAPYSNLDDFLAIAQIMEDFAVGAYKTFIKKIFQQNPDDNVKQFLFRLASTESRHAYMIRNLRAQNGFSDLKGWINDTDSNTIPSSLTRLYQNEDNTTQQDIDVPSITEVPVQSVREAWDEPLDRIAVDEVFDLFNKSFNYFGANASTHNSESLT